MEAPPPPAPSSQSATADAAFAILLRPPGGEAKEKLALKMPLKKDPPVREKN